MRIPRVPDKARLPPGNARWAALLGGVLVLSVMLAVIIGTMGWFGFATGDGNAGQQVEARVVTGQPCDQPGTEVVAFQQDGKERQARFDGCGHQEGEPVQVRVSSADDPVVRAADATPGEGDDGRRLGLVLLTVSGVAGSGYALLMWPELRTRLGPLRPMELRLRRRR